MTKTETVETRLPFVKQRNYCVLSYGNQRKNINSNLNMKEIRDPLFSAYAKFSEKTITSYPLLKLITSLTVISEAATGGVLKNLERFTGKHLSEPLFY